MWFRHVHRPEQIGPVIDRLGSGPILDALYQAIQRQWWRQAQLLAYHVLDYGTLEERRDAKRCLAKIPPSA
jgi:hypothetical protein